MKNLICASLLCIVMLAACAADQQPSKPPPADSTPHPEGLYADNSVLYIRASPAGPPVRLQSLVIGEEAASSNQPPPVQPVQKTAAQAGSSCPLDNSKPPAAEAKLLQPKKGTLPGRLP